MSAAGVQTTRCVAVGQVFTVQLVVQSGTELVIGVEAEFAFNPAVLSRPQRATSPALAEPSYELGRIDRTGLVHSAAWLMLGVARVLDAPECSASSSRLLAEGSRRCAWRTPRLRVLTCADFPFTQGAAPTVTAVRTTAPTMSLEQEFARLRGDHDGRRVRVEDRRAGCPNLPERYRSCRMDGHAQSPVGHGLAGFWQPVPPHWRSVCSTMRASLPRHGGG